MDNGVVVSLVAFRGEFANLKVIGQLPNKTNGTLYLVDPDSIEKEFEAVLGEDIIATNVQMKIMLHKSQELKHEQSG